MSDLDDLRALSAAATPGPWQGDSTEIYGQELNIWVAETLNADDGADGVNNTRFIVAAANYVRDLLAQPPLMHDPWDFRCAKNIHGEPTRRDASCPICSPVPA